ncbi:DUF5689 domain-containing protein [Melioribacteraceae bacterium 4301-Me]|uniref:DUF5689 domain-containing protein n=1 Tax=Pyranulibacter aquaticus TaxID=3163344 RepID=UPI00359A98E9
MLFSITNKLFIRAILFIFFIVLIPKIYSQDITPLRTIKTNDSDGMSTWVQAPSINVTGIVTSITELGTGTAGPGTIQDSETGIAIYGNFFSRDGGLKKGDSVIVYDVHVQAYNGLTELSYNPNSSVQIISSGHVVNPVEIKLADFSDGWDGFEKYESMLVMVKNVTFTDTATTFSLNGKSGWSYHITDGVDTVQFRIVRNTPYYIDKPIPKGLVNIVGIVSQYDASAPYNSGYEIFPIDSTSISPVTSVNFKHEIDNSYNLYQNYPNPFNPSTKIGYQLPVSGFVSLKVYDLLGREIATLVNENKLAGKYEATFNAEGLPSGIYIYRLTSGSKNLAKKMLLVK